MWPSSILKHSAATITGLTVDKEYHRPFDPPAGSGRRRLWDRRVDARSGLGRPGLGGAEGSIDFEAHVAHHVDEG